MVKQRRRKRASTPESQEVLRTAIIDATCRLFRKGGYSAVSMRKVADQVGCTAGALYRYFPDKQTLLLHVWEEDMRYAAKYIWGAVDNATDPVDKIRQTFLGYLRYWERNPENFYILFGPVAEGFDRTNAPDVFPRTGSTALYFSMREHMANLLEGKKNAPSDVDLAMQCLLCAVHGVMALHLSASHFPWFNLQDIARVSIDSILAGWGVIDKPETSASAIKRREPPSV